MTDRAPRNMAASIHQKLKNEAARTGELFNVVLQHYTLERFLYRLSKSDHVGRFVLKGALLFRVWGLSLLRATRDIDLLGQISNEAESVSSIIRDVCTIATEDDGLSFDGDSVGTARITEDAEYVGLRVRLAARLGNARVPIQVDIGFGDPVSPEPEWAEYPTILGMDAPRLRVYPPETAIAEKLQVMLRRRVLNSRMKDYFDVWALAESRSFRGERLSEAIRQTCDRRGTPIVSRPAALSDAMVRDEEKQLQWRAFHRRITPTAAPESFSEIVDRVSRFLGPVVESVSGGQDFHGAWEPGGPWS